MSTGKAPIAVFIYRRPTHLRETLQSLRQCSGAEDARIVVFGDGPASAVHAADVAAARDVARQVLGDRAEYRFSAENRGLAASVIAGVGEILLDHERVIVVEDDLRLSPDSLGFMNAALERYAEDTEVFQVSAHIVDVPEFATRSDALFLPFTTSWGWATWRRAWSGFDADAEGWERLCADRSLRHRFNVGGAVDYAGMLERQMSGVGDSWAIRWYWSVFRRSGLVLFPPRSMVRNTGLDGTGTHGRGLFRRGRHDAGLRSDGVPRMPGEILVDPVVFAAVRRALWSENGGWLGQLGDAARRMRWWLAEPRARHTSASREADGSADEP